MAKKKKFTEAEVGFAQALVVESDRGCVLAAQGFIDAGLGNLLRAKFRFESNASNKILADLLSEGMSAPLGSFGPRARVAFVLGLVTEQRYAALKSLNDLRNHFAHHSGPVTLSRERVDLVCADSDKSILKLGRELFRLQGERFLKDQSPNFSEQRLDLMAAAFNFNGGLVRETEAFRNKWLKKYPGGPQ